MLSFGASPPRRAVCPSTCCWSTTARAIWRARHRTLAVLGVELSLFSVALFVAINEALYNGPTPYAADVAGETATDA